MICSRGRALEFTILPPTFLNKMGTQKDLCALLWTKLRLCAIWLACLIAGGNSQLPMPPIFTIGHPCPTFNGTHHTKRFIASSLRLTICAFSVALHTSSSHPMFGQISSLRNRNLWCTWVWHLAMMPISYLCIPPTMSSLPLHKPSFRKHNFQNVTDLPNGQHKFPLISQRNRPLRPLSLSFRKHLLSHALHLLTHVL